MTELLQEIGLTADDIKKVLNNLATEDIHTREDLQHLEPADLKDLGFTIGLKNKVLHWQTACALVPKEYHIFSSKRESERERERARERDTVRSSAPLLTFQACP